MLCTPFHSKQMVPTKIYSKPCQCFVAARMLYLIHYENTSMQNTEIFTPGKIENFQWKNSDVFNIYAQNIDCGYTLEPPQRGGSNEYPQSMFWIKNKKNRYTPANPIFTI